MISAIEKIRHCDRLWPKRTVKGQTAKLLDPSGGCQQHEDAQPQGLIDQVHCAAE